MVRQSLPTSTLGAPTHFSARCSPNTKFTSAPSSIFLYTSLMSFCGEQPVGFHQVLQGTAQAGCHTAVSLGVAGAAGVH